MLKGFLRLAILSLISDLALAFAPAVSFIL
jgi:hypothetical protein